MAKVVFYCNDTRSNIDLFEYYRQDIEALTALGHEVRVCTRYREIPLRFDVMYVWWWTYALYPVLLSRLLRRPVITTGTFNFRFPPGFDGTDYFARPWWQRLLISLATRWSTLNLFVNRQELDGCSAHFRLRNARYFPHVVNDDYLRGPGARRTCALFNISWSGKQNLVRKGIPELIQAAASLKERFPDLQLLLAGRPGDGQEFLMDMVQKAGLQRNVTLLGPLSREDKIRRLRECEIYVQPSHYEGFGLAIVEAMGSGACIVTCDVGAVGDVVGDSGLYVSPGSPGELAQAIARVLDDEALRRSYQARALLRARSEFAFQSKLVRMRAYLGEVGVS